MKKNLPKWPAMIVKGKPVTTDQAKEIIIRTDSFNFYSNDRSFERQINKYLYGVECNSFDRHEAIEKKHGIKMFEAFEMESAKQLEYGIIQLEYLNNSRILSSWIGGPHGWCNWNGYIGCNNYNIGKYPAEDEVFEEWKRIAEAFPFLSLKCQLLSGETCGDNLEPVVEYRIDGGIVGWIEEPTELLDHPNNGSTGADIAAIFSNPVRERGCTFEEFKAAAELVRAKISNL